MGNPWFRYYTEALDDPKVQMLPDPLFKIWVNLLCLACKHDGILPPMEDIAFALRAPLSETEDAVSTLLKGNLLDERKNQHGQTLSPHNWAKRQFKSDSSTERVKRFRNVARNKDVTPSESESEQRKKQKKSSAILDKPKRPLRQSFDEWWQTEILTSPAYRGINLERELEKMKVWLTKPENRGRKLTTKYALNWLNKIDPGESVNGHGSSDDGLCSRRVMGEGKSNPCTQAAVVFIGNHGMCRPCHDAYKKERAAREGVGHVG